MVVPVAGKACRQGLVQIEEVAQVGAAGGHHGGHCQNTHPGQGSFYGLHAKYPTFWFFPDSIIFRAQTLGVLPLRSAFHGYLADE